MSLKRSVGDSSFLVSRLSSPPLPPSPKESRQEGKFIAVGGMRVCPSGADSFPVVVICESGCCQKALFLKSRSSCPPEGKTLVSRAVRVFMCVLMQKEKQNTQTQLQHFLLESAKFQKHRLLF